MHPKRARHTYNDYCMSGNNTSLRWWIERHEHFTCDTVGASRNSGGLHAVRVVPLVVALSNDSNCLLILCFAGNPSLRLRCTTSRPTYSTFSTELFYLEKLLVMNRAVFLLRTTN